MTLLRFRTGQTRESDAAPLPFLAVGGYEMPGWGHSSIVDIAFFGQIREPAGVTVDVVKIQIPASMGNFQKKKEFGGVKWNYKKSARTSFTPKVVFTPHIRPIPPTATNAVAIPNAFAAISADEAFIRDNADIISPTPGEVPSELNASTAPVVDPGAEPDVMDFGSKFAVVLDDLRGGGDAEFFKDDRRTVLSCLRTMKRGIASARLVPMNCWKCQLARVRGTENGLRTADTGTHFGTFRGRSESYVVGAEGGGGDDDDDIGVQGR